MNAKNKILITGSSGFIGYHVASYFLSKEYIVYGVDNHNNYYDYSRDDEKMQPTQKI